MFQNQNNDSCLKAKQFKTLILNVSSKAMKNQTFAIQNILGNVIPKHDMSFINLI